MDVSSSTRCMELGQLQMLASSDCPAKLEAGVETGLQILSDVKAAFGEAQTVPEIAKWIEKSDKLRSETAYTRTIIGVVGSTGAGKSSVINAVLDEECLVPTNCMRACTAVITEICHNNSDRDEEKYRAEIHFISRSDWVKELGIMMKDMATGQDQLGTEHTSSESEASIAYDKIRAVYPFLKSDEVKKGQFNLEELIDHFSVKELFGTVKQVASSNSKDFMDLLKRFIDSKEKTRGRKKEPDAMEYWPLIEVVKVFVRSPILESGLVLVDLPGVHDSNAARSAVAQRYIKQCSGLWVVAPINRAVDDRVAQKLLGESFKRQLQFDGTYSSVTVICSKADDISVTEALKAVPQEAKPHQLHGNAELLDAEREKLQMELETLTQRSFALKEETEQCLNEIETLKSAIRGPDDEEEVIVFSPGGSLKRPSRGAAFTARKRLRQLHDSDSEETDSTLDDELVDLEAEPEKELISRGAARLRLEEAEARFSQLRDEHKELRQRRAPQQKALKEKKVELRSLKTQVKHACIKYRNDYARPAIQVQFAQGIRELDQANAAEDDENFDPSFVHRNYEEVAAKLPVFCVSSKAYQKISGRLEDDERVAGFLEIEDTEIPALQRHALGIVHETRSVVCRRFLNNLGGYLTSLHLQVVQSHQPLKLAEDIKQEELRFLAASMTELKKDLDSAMQEAFMHCRKAVDVGIFQRLASAARVASDAAVPTVKSWISHKDDGGLAFQTFRATCIRDGVFKGAKGPMDFNKALAKPMSKHLAGTWEYVFSSSLPDRIDILAETLGHVLRSFRRQMRKSAEITKAPSFALANRQVKILEGTLKDTADLKATISTGQKEASRLFVPCIGEAMAECYAACAEESGIGCYKRMKAHITEHVETVRGTMFRDAARKTESSIICTLDELEVEIEKKVEEIVRLISRDYTTLLVDQNIFKALSTSRDGVGRLLAQVDERFEKVLRLEIPVEPASIKREDTAAMAIDQEAPAPPPSSMLSASGAGSLNATPTVPVDNSERTRAEASSPIAPGDDVPMRDA